MLFRSVGAARRPGDLHNGPGLDGALVEAVHAQQRLVPALHEEAQARRPGEHERVGAREVRRDGDWLAMDFPAWPPSPCPPSDVFAQALGRAPREILGARDYLCVFGSAAEVKELKPDMARIAALDRFAVCVTAPGDGDCDFVSRFFAPAKGVPEDPVTGSAHCMLIPYWARRLGKTTVLARQVSTRGGELRCALRGERVGIAGKAVLYLEGHIDI